MSNDDEKYSFIRVRRETWIRLTKLKLGSKDSYDDVINRILNILEV